MTTEPKTIQVTAGSELARLVDAATDTPVILEKDGVRYRLSREPDDVWTSYDARAVRGAIRSAAGTLDAAEGEELKHSIYRAREEGSRPADRP
jgi:hypothetical protein